MTTKPDKANASPLTEDKYLAEQAELGSQAMQHMQRKLADTLKRSADVGSWASRYPWPAVGGAAAVGVAAAAAVKPQSAAAQKREYLKAAARDYTDTVRKEFGLPKAPRLTPGEKKAAAATGILSPLVAIAGNMLKNMAVSALQSQMQGQQPDAASPGAKPSSAQKASYTSAAL